MKGNIEMMRTGEIGKKFIKGKEGYSSAPYLCTAGKPTIGYGTTRYPSGKKVSMSDPKITKEQADIYFENDLRVAEKIVNRKITTSLSQGEFDMLVAHTQNTGGSDTLFRLINQKSDLSIIEDWWTNRYITVNQGKTVVKGLVNRRKEEFEIFKKYYDK